MFWRVTSMSRNAGVMYIHIHTHTDGTVLQVFTHTHTHTHTHIQIHTIHTFTRPKCLDNSKEKNETTQKS